MKNNYLKNLKRGAQIGMLGVALAVNPVLNTACKQPQTIEENKNGDQPYNKTIGNGNYVLHSFIGENTTFDYNNAFDATNKYLNKAEKYFKGSADNLKKSLNGRPTAQNYFGDYITKMQANDYFYIDEHKSSKNNIDRAFGTVSKSVAPIMQDIIKNLDTENERQAFDLSYRILATEAYKEGLGAYRKEDNSRVMEKYQNKKNYLLKLVAADKRDGGYFINVDIDNEYGQGNFQQTTNIMDQMLNRAVQNMNERNNLDLRVDDLQQAVSDAINTESFRAMHDCVGPKLGHTGSCNIAETIITDAMYEAMVEASIKDKQNNNMVR